MEIEARKSLLEKEFEAYFGSSPSLWSQAPGRVDLMGSHTDYNMGFVLTQAIDRNVWIAARPRDDGVIRVCSLDVEGCGKFYLDGVEFNHDVPWTNYVGGVADILQQEGYVLTGFDGLIHSTVPIGSGLSSSAALEVSTAVLLDTLGGLDIDPVKMAILCQRAENEFVGMNCGILDQYTSMMGEAGSVLLLDCRDITSKTKPVAEGIQVVICDTRAKRELTGSEYPERRAQCEEGVRLLSEYDQEIGSLRDVSQEFFESHEQYLPEVIARRCRFVIEENQRVLDMAEALAKGDVDDIGRLAIQSFAGARDLYEISNFEMEMMMDAMVSAPGVIGSRQAGAGFGGCMVAFVEADSVETFSSDVHQRYLASTGITPEIYPVQAAPGAGILEF